MFQNIKHQHILETFLKTIVIDKLQTKTKNH